MARSPAWVRALLAVDRAVTAGATAWAIVRDELLWALVRPERRAAVTAAVYARQGTYVPGGALFEHGLREWEEQLLAHPALPRGGRALVGGVGGGRELRVLCERGYRVTAFEPAPALAAAAAQVAARWPGATAHRGGYEDLPGAAAGEGPLAALAREGPYDLVFLGWRSLSHVVDEEGRRRAFEALARLAPAAPVALSFSPRLGPVPGPRRAVRRLLRRLGGGEVPDGALFLPWAGFAVSLDRGDFERAAGPAGYRVASYATEPDGRAVLVRG